MNEIAEYCKQIRSCCAELSAFLRTTNELVRLAETVNSHIDWPRREPEPWRLSREQAEACRRLGVDPEAAEAQEKAAFERKSRARQRAQAAWRRVTTGSQFVAGGIGEYEE